MRTLSTPTGIAVASTITTPAYLVELGFSAVVRLSSRNDQSWNGQTWLGGRIRKVSGLTQDANGGQSGSLELINTDLVYSALILNEDAADKSCRIWKFYGDNPALSDPVQVFSGVLNETDIGPDVVRVSLVGENSRTMFSPRRFIGKGTGFNHLRPTGTKITWGGQVYVLERAKD